jgi:16S rRNA processing protein RimM
LTDLLDVGVITKPHGLRGEVIVKLTTNRGERLEPGSVLQSDRGPLLVQSASPHQHGWIVRFDAIVDRNDAEAARGLVLRAEPLDLPDELWVHELIDAEVVDGAGTVLGRCTAVEANPASDLIVLDGGGLIPLRFVTAHEPGRVTVDPPAGLLEL